MSQFKTALIILAFLAIGFITGFVKSAPQETPVNNTIEDGDIPETLLRSYQIQLIDKDHAVVYDGFRYVGTIRVDIRSQLGRVLFNDNP